MIFQCKYHLEYHTHMPIFWVSDRNPCWSSCPKVSGKKSCESHVTSNIFTIFAPIRYFCQPKNSSHSSVVFWIRKANKAKSAPQLICEFTNVGSLSPYQQQYSAPRSTKHVKNLWNLFLAAPPARQKDSLGLIFWSGPGLFGEAQLLSRYCSNCCPDLHHQLLVLTGEINRHWSHWSN